ncbi:glutamate receptor 2.8-like isoform X1 [Olea europaea var. sylvestris]|uniref:glutamate receptor 2.8-like isoform X1 n=1 Tax=Olea europaea var. sylvestris TaxID=158386 RepID=UPI000C1D648D|nr:glutamate receptor 2.8-like isoform X1 [Olea europaea var. sylvestris]
MFLYTFRLSIMKTFFLLLFFLITFALKPEGINGVEQVIGAILDCDTRVGKEERVAMDIAIQDFNMEQNQTFIKLRSKCSQQKPLQAALAARHLISKNKVQLILGPRSWEETSTVAEASEHYDVPILSFADSSPPWAPERWPFLVQAVASTYTQMKAVANIIQSWGWHRANVIYEDTDSAANGISPYLYGALQEVDVQISNLLPLPSFADSSLLQKKLEELKTEQYRVFVVHTSLALATRIFGLAKEMKMMDKGYVWITTDSITSLVHSMNFSLVSSMQGVVGVRDSFLETGPDFRSFFSRFLQIFGRKYPEERHHEPGIFALQAYDAVRTVGLAWNQGEVNSGRQLLESILKTDFDGLSGKIQFTQQKLEPATRFQIINIIGKGYRELGFWTGKGFSSSIDDGVYNSSMESLGHVIWPGDPWCAPRGWDLPTIENPLRIGVPNGSLTNKFVEVDYDPSTNQYNFSGFSVDVFNETAKHLKYSLQYKFVPFEGNYTDLVKKVQSREFDAAVGDIAITSSRCEYVDFTYPYTESGLVMVVPILVSHSSTTWLFVKPFTRDMWLLTLFINVFNGFVVWSIERSYCSELKGPVLNQIGTLLWLAFATLFSLHAEKLHSNLSRMAMVVWLFVALIITQSYTASLTSMLTVQNLVPKVANIETIKSKNAMIGYSQKSFVEGYLEGPLGFKSNNIRSFATEDEYAKALRSGAIAAAFLEAPVAKLFVAKYCKSFTIAGPAYQVGGYGFAFPKGSLLLPEIDEALLNVLENGVLKDLEERLIKSEECVDIQSDNETASLSPNNFFVLFIFTGGTSTTALLIYYFRATDRFKNSMAQYKRIWIKIVMVLNKLGYRRNRLSTEVSDVADKNPWIAPNNLHSRSQV